MAPRTIAVWSFVLLLTGGGMSAFGATPTARSYSSRSPTGSPNAGRQQLMMAQSELSKAQATLNRLKEHGERALETTPAWSKAKEAVAEAEKNRKTVREQITARVAATPEYQALAQHSEASNSEIEKAEDRAKMAGMVSDAMDASPEWASARARLDKANADVAAQWKAYESDVLAHDQAWTSALAARDAARARVSAALRNPTRMTGGPSGMSRSSGYRSSRNSYGNSSRSSGYRSSSSRYR